MNELSMWLKTIRRRIGEMASEWKVTSNRIGEKRVYGVYRLVKPAAVDHSGNREVYGGYVDSKEEAQAIADELNNGHKRCFVKNGESEYYIIDLQKDILLLQRSSDGEIVIAYNYELEGATVTWQHGTYFGDNLLAAAQKFYGKKRKKTSTEIAVQERSISDQEIHYLRQLSEKSFSTNFSKGTTLQPGMSITLDGR